MLKVISILKLCPLCLLEEVEEGKIKLLIKEEVEWVNKWFSEIHPWTLTDVDNEMLTWMRCYGLPCHVWKKQFFEFISKPVGTFVCMDQESNERKKMDVARFLIRTKYYMILNESINIGVNDNTYSIKLVEYMHGPKRIVVPKEWHEGILNESSSEMEEGEWEGSDGEVREEEYDGNKSISDEKEISYDSPMAAEAIRCKG